MVLSEVTVSGASLQNKICCANRLHTDQPNFKVGRGIAVNITVNDDVCSGHVAVDFCNAVPNRVGFGGCVVEEESLISCLQGGRVGINAAQINGQYPRGSQRACPALCLFWTLR